MRKPLLLLLMLLGFTALLATAWQLTDSRTRLTIFQPNGFIRAGSLFAVAVGDTRSSSRSALQNQRMTLRGASNGGTCFFRAVAADRQLDVFFVQTWHGGTICTVSRNERVEEVIWAFQPVSL